MSVPGLSRSLCLALVFLLVVSCQSAVTPTPRPIERRPEQVIKREPRIALVLGGGSSKGFTHVGVIRVLEQEKIPIHMVVGASVGSLIGGIYAARPDSFQLEWTAFKIDRNDILDFSIVSKMGPVLGVRLEEFVEQNVKTKKVEETKIPFVPVATDLNTGETVTLDKGSMARAIRASSSIPGIFPPVSFGNRTLVDGGVTDNVPCDIAKAKGADIIIAVNLQKDIRNDQIDSIVDVIGQSISIMMRESSKAKMACADVIIEPDAKGVGMFDFTRKKQLMEEGIKAAKAAMPRIREAIARFGKQ